MSGPAAVIVDATGANIAEVKAASTPAVAADKALVVSVSPNNTPVLPAGAATQATLTTLLTEADFDARVGNVHASPTANTVLGRLKDLYDRFIAQLPAALVGGRLDTNIGAWLGSTSPTIGQKTAAQSIPVTLASNQPAIEIIVIDSQVPLDRVVRQKLLNGAASNMIVAGTLATPVDFTFNADPTVDIFVESLLLVITTDNTYFDNNHFIEKVPLTNGCLLEITSEATTMPLATLKKSEDFLDLHALVSHTLEFNGINDVLIFRIALPRVKLVAGSSDRVRMRIRDTINDGTIKYVFTCTVVGVKA